MKELSIMRKAGGMTENRSGPLTTLKRSCWWCGKKLMATSHAEVRTPDGIVCTHKLCAEDAEAHFRHVTARPRMEQT